MNDQQPKWKGKTGPAPKERTAKQITITMSPDLYDALIEYMQSNGLVNRSGTISGLIRSALNG